MLKQKYKIGTVLYDLDRYGKEKNKEYCIIISHKKDLYNIFYVNENNKYMDCEQEIALNNPLNYKLII